MKKMLKIVGIVFIILIVLIILIFIKGASNLMVPENYTTEVETGGEIEEKYLKLGNSKVKNIEMQGSEVTKHFIIYYPEKIENDDRVYPVIVMLNGTGVSPKQYLSVFEHFASWGFVVIGSEDGDAGYGKSADETVELVNKVNIDKNSIFYQKLDLNNMGIVGHSQGGAGVFTALSIMKYKDRYKTAVALSPTHEEFAHQVGWNYDLQKINIPLLVFAGTKGDFETKTVIPLDKMEEMYNKIQSTKAMARRTGEEHPQMLYSANGYVVAWFMWQLQGDKYAEKAFIGDNPELLTNHLYQNQQINIEN